MGLWLEQKFGFTATSLIRGAEADALAEKIDRELGMLNPIYNTKFEFCHDPSDSCHRFYFGWHIGKVKHLYEGQYIDLNELQSGIVEASKHKDAIITALDSLKKDFPELAAMTWTQEPKGFFWTYV